MQATGEEGDLETCDQRLIFTKLQKGTLKSSESHLVSKPIVTESGTDTTTTNTPPAL